MPRWEDVNKGELEFMAPRIGVHWPTRPKSRSRPTIDSALAPMPMVRNLIISQCLNIAVVVLKIARLLPLAHRQVG